jgi:acyl-CoA synthetase (AMP-forming)/AMP-acid ligase II
MMTTFLDALDGQDAAMPALEDDTEAITYGELRRQARRAAARVATYGRRQYLVIRATPTVRFVTTLLGVMYSGNVPVPVDPDLPAHALDFITAQSGAIELLNPFQLEEIEGFPSIDRRTDTVPALILFTSGTTGRPKGVIISHANLLHSCRAISGYLGYERHRSAAVCLPLHYSYALLSQVCCQLAAGGRVRIFGDLRNPIKFSRSVNAQQLETFCGVPSTFQALSLFHAMSPLCMPTIRVLCSAGAAMDRSKLAIIKEIFPNSTFFNNYGMTEAAPRIAYIREDDPRFDEPTCGKPIEGVDVKVVDPSTFLEVPEGDTGVLVVRGPNITSGYLNDAGQTERAFTPDGYLISGDIAYIRDGYIFICGRHDDIFNSGGEKIAPLEIERALNTIDGVEMSAVTGWADEQRGAVPIAFLKLTRCLSRREVVERLSAELTHARIPARLLEVSAFPMTANGKLQRRQLSPDDPTYVIREIH